VKSKYFCTLVGVAENIGLFLILVQENKEKIVVPTNMLCLSSMKITQ